MAGVLRSLSAVQNNPLQAYPTGARASGVCALALAEQQKEAERRALSGVKRTFGSALAMSDNDPKRT